jgi:hypothetical protein
VSFAELGTDAPQLWTTYVSANASAKPGGLWISPGDGTTITNQLHFAARAYPTNPGDAQIDYVNFTVWFPGVGPEDGPWFPACTVSAPDHEDGHGDVYKCDVDLAVAPDGPVKVSFDVYDKSGNHNLAPNGIRTITKSSPSADQPAPDLNPAPVSNPSAGLNPSASADADGDGVPDGSDNCPTANNPNQSDVDGDRQGDACDNQDNRDSDGDGIQNWADQCPNQAENPNGYEDTDGCPDSQPGPSDSDGDGVPDGSDNCPTAHNPNQSDVDGDRQGDACDSQDNRDSDGDGIQNWADECPNQAESPNGYQDSDGCPDSSPTATPGSPPAAPTDAWISPIYCFVAPCSAGELWWTDTDNEDGFYVYVDYGVEFGCGLERLTQLPKNTQSWTLPPEEASACIVGFRYGVSAFNAAGESAISWAPEPSPPPSTDYSGELTADRGEGGWYVVEDKLTLCYYLDPQTPFHFRIFEMVDGGPETLVWEDDDDGTGYCQRFTITPSDVGYGSDEGRDDFRIEFWVSGQLVAEATTYIFVSLGVW